MKRTWNGLEPALAVYVGVIAMFTTGCGGPSTQPSSRSARAAGSTAPEPPAQKAPVEGQAQQHIDKGDELLRSGALQAAVVEYTEAIRIDSRQVAAFMHRGVAYARLKQYDAAVADFTHLIKTGVADVPMVGLGPDVYYSRGGVYAEMRDNARAIADFSSGIRVASLLCEAQQQQGGMLDFSPMLRRSLLRLHHVRAQVYRLTKEYDKALRDYDEALRLFPEEAVLYRDRAALHEIMGHGSDAAKDLEQYESLMQKVKEK